MTSPRRLSIVIATIVALLVLAGIYASREKQSYTEIAAPSLTVADIQPATASTAPPGPIPEEELRSALADVCSTDTPEVDNTELALEDIPARVDAFNALMLSLSASASAEHLHLAALLENDPPLRIALLDRAITSNPDDAFLLWSAVHICSEFDEPTTCPLRDWERRLLDADSQNSESWIRVAANRYAEGEYDAALAAMRYASTAAESRAYWTEMIEMIERGFAAGSDHTFPVRAEMAFGIAASKLPRYGDYVTMCSERSAQNVDWAYSCLAYGELVEVQGKTEMGVAIALSIQKLALKTLGEIAGAAAAEQRIQARRRRIRDAAGPHNDVTARLIISNSTWFSAFLAAVRSQGEVEAQVHLAKEIERLVEQQPKFGCESI